MNARLLFFPAIILLASCTGPESGKSRGPIVLGDSSAIVTETNAVLLQDQVADLQPVNTGDDSTAAASKSTATDTTVQQSSNNRPTTVQQPSSGLTAAFKEVTLAIPGITTRMYGKADLQAARGASYELTSGNLAGAQLRVSGSPVTRVSQRTQTMLKLKDGADELVLESLPKYTSGWQPLTGAGGAYPIAGLEPDKLEYQLPSSSALKNAVQAAARKAKLDRKETQEWLEAARDLRSANAAPAVIVLRGAMWRVEGKGFSKELRVDVPLK